MASSFLSPAAGADAAADTGAIDNEIQETTTQPDASGAGETSGDVDAGGGEPSERETTQSQDTAGKADPLEFKKHIQEVSKVNKKLADQLKGDRYKVAKFEEAGFKTPEEAVALRDMLETYGGQEGLEALQADAQEFGQEIAQMAAGDPKLLDKLAAESPDGLAKLIPYGVNLFKKLNPEGYQSLKQTLTHEEFEANNVYSHVQLLLDTITAGGEGAQKRAAELAQTLQGYLDGFKKAGAKGSGVDKEREEFLKEKQTYEQKKAEEADETFASSVLNTVNPEVTKAVRTHLQSFVPKGYKLPENTENKIIEEVFAGINAKLNEKQDYQSRYQALLKTKDHKRLSSFIRSRVDPVLRDLTKSVYDVFRGANPTMRRAAPPANGNANRQPAPATGAKTYRPTLQEAMRMGLSKEEWLQGATTKKLVKNGKTLYQWN